MTPARCIWIIALAALAAWCWLEHQGRLDECALHGIPAEQCREALYR